MDDPQLLRYSRQILMPQVGYEGQQRLLDSSALIIGLGGLGSPVALYLAAAGVGRLVISDFDEVDLSNLQRQILHRHVDLGRSKAESARDTLHDINPEIEIEAISEKLEGQALAEQIAKVDIVIDACDNFATRFMINDLCVAAGKPLVSGAAIRLEGQVSVFHNERDDSPCYRCLYKDEGELGERCSESGVLSPLVGIIGSIQAMEAIKVLLGLGETLGGRLLLLDALTMEWRSMKLRKDPGCPVCGGQ
ncbi:hypothetical protein BOW53_14855 [Solemya pervernicosa gill symbiont]|uniref:Molybdopterin-synthase adenylyltransferase n=2 Tax=Gammaproteobacteria incertae sedis TaxID=118884 RepID=A0A1T2L0Y8_9GAMM|nr:molybdopterin-synthase adenylyltransferase MoeB [Candidatus Reidiella endopervernicosa]OOZ38616.1 hypothetical protein BOW53_14855 [Solemya pervernicosa gill symbiont]QKQ25992.1 molybdopterin-synthase adenylyltransferase MoeB [Candidatus Reidiella endopervernicosa]